MSVLPSRQVFREAALCCLERDEPIAARCPETGIALHYRFCHVVGGRLSLSEGLLGSDVLTVGCDEGELNLVATVLLDGLRVRLP